MIVSLPAFTSQHLALGNKDHMLTMNDNRGAQIFAVLRMPGLCSRDPAYREQMQRYSTLPKVRVTLHVAAHVPGHLCE